MTGVAKALSLRTFDHGNLLLVPILNLITYNSKNKIF